jgi:hypothetical protein
VQVSFGVTRVQCYDHQFKRRLPILDERIIGVFLDCQCYEHFSA